jgi:hypothetical protein
MKKLWGMASLVVLAGCGGDSGTSSTLAPFVNWDTSLKANQTFQVSGISFETTLISDSTDATFSSASDAVERSVSLTGTVNASANGLTRFAITSNSGRSLSFSSGIIKEKGYFYALNLNRTEELSLADPADLDWNYQSFGFWENKSQNFSLTTEGFYSVGVVTSDAALLSKTGKATYTGAGAFSYYQVGFNQERYKSNITVEADFSKRELNFDSKISGGPPNLNFTGALSYGQQNSSVFRGDLSNTDLSLTGSAVGKFYGPAAQEIGGVFSLKSSSGDQRVFGAFGAAQ